MLLDSRDHQIANILALDARRCRNIAHGLAVAAVERKGDANTFGIVAGKFKTIGTPAEMDCSTAMRPSCRRSA